MPERCSAKAEIIISSHETRSKFIGESDQGEKDDGSQTKSIHSGRKTENAKETGYEMCGTHGSLPKPPRPSFRDRHPKICGGPAMLIDTPQCGGEIPTDAYTQAAAVVRNRPGMFELIMLRRVYKSF